jgi:hypothetical protein
MRWLPASSTPRTLLSPKTGLTPVFTIVGGRAVHDPGGLLTS